MGGGGAVVSASGSDSRKNEFLVFSSTHAYRNHTTETKYVV